jgi:YVTN family beta-propeller protein
MSVSQRLLALAVGLAALPAAPASAAPFAYVPNEKSGSVSVIDTATDKVVDVIALEGVKGGGPFRLQYSPDGRRLLTTTIGVNVLNVFDATNLRGRQLVVPVGRDPFGVAFSKDGKTALVSNHGDGTITVVDVATGTVKSSFTAGTGIETLSYF